MPLNIESKRAVYTEVVFQYPEMLLKALLNVFKVQDFTYASATFRKRKKKSTLGQILLYKKVVTKLRQ